MKYLALSGGVGGAKLALGLDRQVGQGEILIVANTADDFVYHGLHISPDIDTLVYTLAGVSNPETGWGRAGESWNYMAACAELGRDTWFSLGDKDLAVHLLRAERLAQGATLGEVTAELCQRFGLGNPVVPMSDDPVRTIVTTSAGILSFQEYFVKHSCDPRVYSVNYQGVEQARPSAALVELLESDSLRGILICPSNPLLSILPILELQGMKTLIERSRAPCIVVSPVVAGRAMKGPTTKIMNELGMQGDVRGIAGIYGDLADIMVIDSADRDHAAGLEDAGLEVQTTDIVMRTLEDKEALAAKVLEYCSGYRP